jgi:hypothetical protein
MCDAEACSSSEARKTFATTLSRCLRVAFLLGGFAAWLDAVLRGYINTRSKKAGNERKAPLADW